MSGDARASASSLCRFTVSLYQGKIDLKRIGSRGELPSGAISQQLFESIKDVFGRLSNSLALRVDARNFLHVAVKTAFLAGFKDDSELLHLVLRHNDSSGPTIYTIPFGSIGRN